MSAGSAPCTMKTTPAKTAYTARDPNQPIEALTIGLQRENAGALSTSRVMALASPSPRGETSSVVFMGAVLEVLPTKQARKPRAQYASVRPVRFGLRLVVNGNAMSHVAARGHY